MSVFIITGNWFAYSFDTILFFRSESCLRGFSFSHGRVCFFLNRFAVVRRRSKTFFTQTWLFFWVRTMKYLDFCSILSQFVIRTSCFPLCASRVSSSEIQWFSTDCQTQALWRQWNINPENHSKLSNTVRGSHYLFQFYFCRLPATHFKSPIVVWK